MDSDKRNNREQEIPIITPLSSEEEQLVVEALLRGSHSEEAVRKEWDGFERRIAGKNDRRGLLLKVASAAVLVVSAAMLWFMQADNSGQNVVYEARNATAEVKHTYSEREDKHISGRANEKKTHTVEWKIVDVPAGKDYRLTLPDGSEVWINAESRLSYPTQFDENIREVELVGEAYFKVVADKSHPFIVRSEGTSTKALGTEFNVEARQGGRQRITLVSGKVEVSCSQAGKTAHLSPSEAAMIEGGKMDVAQVNADDIVCWRDGIELYDDATLSEILIRIGCWYNLTVVCRDDEALSHRLHFVYDRTQDVRKVVRSLSQISKTKIILEKNTIFVE